MYFGVTPDCSIVWKILMIMLSVMSSFLIVTLHIWLRSDRDTQTNTRLPEIVFRASHYIDRERRKENMNVV